MIKEELHPRRERSRNKVLIALKNESKRFKDLEKETKLSPAGLTQILKLLKKENEIESTLIDGKPGYRLTKKGISSADDLINLANDVNAIRSRGGKNRRYSFIFEEFLKPKFPWGVTANLTLDKELDKLSLLQEEDIKDIQGLVLQKIVKNIKKQKLNEKHVGQMVLGFVIDYPTLIGTLHMTPKKYINDLSKLSKLLRDKFGHNVNDMMSKEHEKELIKKIQEQNKRSGDKK